MYTIRSWGAYLHILSQKKDLYQAFSWLKKSNKLFFKFKYIQYELEHFTNVIVFFFKITKFAGHSVFSLGMLLASTYYIKLTGLF